MKTAVLLLLSAFAPFIASASQGAFSQYPCGIMLKQLESTREHAALEFWSINQRSPLFRKSIPTVRLRPSRDCDMFFYEHRNGDGSLKGYSSFRMRDGAPLNTFFVPQNAKVLFQRTGPDGHQITYQEYLDGNEQTWHIRLNNNLEQVTKINLNRLLNVSTLSITRMFRNERDDEIYIETEEGHEHSIYFVNINSMQSGHLKRYGNYAYSTLLRNSFNNRVILFEERYSSGGMRIVGYLDTQTHEYRTFDGEDLYSAYTTPFLSLFFGDMKILFAEGSWRGANEIRLINAIDERRLLSIQKKVSHVAITDDNAHAYFANFYHDGTPVEILKIDSKSATIQSTTFNIKANKDKMSGLRAFGDGTNVLIESHGGKNDIRLNIRDSSAHRRIFHFENSKVLSANAFHRLTDTTYTVETCAGTEDEETCSFSLSKWKEDGTRTSLYKEKKTGPIAADYFPKLSILDILSSGRSLLLEQDLRAELGKYRYFILDTNDQSVQKLFDSTERAIWMSAAL